MQHWSCAEGMRHDSTAVAPKACEAIKSSYFPAGAAVCSCVSIAKRKENNSLLLQVLWSEVAGRCVKVLLPTVLQPCDIGLTLHSYV